MEELNCIDLDHCYKETSERESYNAWRTLYENSFKMLIF